jgi:uncharacterized protein YegP (UPF0339 family)
MIRIFKKKKKDGTNYFWYTITGSNGEPLASSEQFTRKANCMKSIYALLEVVRDQNVKVVDETK